MKIKSNRIRVMRFRVSDEDKQKGERKCAENGWRMSEFLRIIYQTAINSHLELSLSPEKEVKHGR